MKVLNDKQKSLLRRCPQWGTFRPGDVTGYGYPHPIGANNGLTGFARLGWLATGWGNHGGKVYQMTEAGRAAVAALDVSTP